MAKLRVSSSPEWLATVLEGFDEFILDHASCERKAAAMALSLVSHYPDRTLLVEAMVELAREELEHFQQMIRVVHERKLTLGPDTRDPYIQELRREIRTGPEAYFLDRLLVAGVVEARGCERFGLVAEALEPGPLKELYRSLTRSEAQHHGLFLRMARTYFEPELVDRRHAELLDREAEIVAALPLRPVVH